MQFNVRVILDSISPSGHRLTTIAATYPRFIHSEVMTHRDRARNAASSRAIPWSKMRGAVVASPVVPIQWPQDRPGMQGGEEIPEKMRDLARQIWVKARDSAVEYADQLANIGRTWVDHSGQHQAEPGDESVMMHKSIPNRIVEPWMWITTIMSATEWANFFRLRCHPDAEVHFRHIAGMIRHCMDLSEPVEVERGEWHRPFVDSSDSDKLMGYRYEGATLEMMLCKVSTARCARVSYLNHDGKRDVLNDLSLFEKLCAGSGFGHWSAHEHCAKSSYSANIRSGPFIGWEQFRKMFPLENLKG